MNSFGPKTAGLSFADAGPSNPSSLKPASVKPGPHKPSSSHRAPVAFLFPGQGSQAVGMCRELASMYPVARQTFDEADAALGYKLSEVCFEGPEEKLRLTEVTQPAILTASVATYRVLQEKGITCNYVAGHSLGEYSAHVAAGTFSFEDAVRTVSNRGRYMQEAVPVGTGAMAALLGFPIEEVVKVCEEVLKNSPSQGAVVQPSNVNSPEQVVIAGSTAAVEQAAELARQRGAKKVVMLPVSAPFHCSMMQPAQDRLAADLERLEFHSMRVPVVSNVDATLLRDSSRARETLIRQVTGTVRWLECVRLLIAQDVQTFVELGPGKVLCGLLRQTDRTRTGLNVEDEASLVKVQNHLLTHKSEAM
ncbi:MAG TPA: ACP S-malonyltransferase [Terriglobales bacterium]|nr:ACP S-malonyltransferase [Terriglobales bacterium]